MRLVLDTNIIVSAFFWEGNEAELLRRIEEGKAIIYTTREILKEIEDVIKRQKFEDIIRKTNTTADEIMQKMISLSHIVVPTNKVDICRDKKDNKFLECAESAEADYIISGDKDLLALIKYKNCFIIKSKVILEKL